MTVSTSAPESQRARPPAPGAAHVGAHGGADDGRLAARLAAGDESAFEELVRTYGPRLLAVARRFVRNEEDAQDVLQDGFLAAFRALKTFRGDCRLSTWLHRIVVNAALMRLRTRRRHPEAPLDDLLPGYLEDGHHASAIQPWGDAERALMAQQTRAQVRAAIDRLPESYRQVVLLRDVEELDTAEVAALLGTTPNAVKIRLHRGRQALITLLTPALTAPAGAGTRP